MYNFLVINTFLEDYMKITKVACVGAGNRGIIYSSFALKFPEKMKVIAVVDPNELHRTEFAKKAR